MLDKQLDNSAKKILIINLTESIETKSDGKFDIKSVFEALEHNRTSDEIISEIKSLIVEQQNRASL
jgi:hypothetical protein